LGLVNVEFLPHGQMRAVAGPLRTHPLPRVVLTASKLAVQSRGTRRWPAAQAATHPPATAGGTDRIQGRRSDPRVVLTASKRAVQSRCFDMQQLGW